MPDSIEEKEFQDLLDDVHRKEQTRRRSSLAFVIICVSIGILWILFSIITVNKLNQQVAEKNRESARLDSLINIQADEISANQTLVAELVDEINRLRDTTINVKAGKVELPGIRDAQNRQIFDFTLWISSSTFTMNKISKVEYQFGHGSFLINNRESTDSSNGFLVSYRGWGCLSIVKAKVTYEDGREETIFFDQCELLNADGQ